MLNMKSIGFSNYCVTKDGDIYSLHVNRVLKPACAQGYLFVSITNDLGKTINKKIHRIVAEVFLTPPSDLHVQVNHIDGCKTNNRLDNLEWLTPQENSQHAIDTGLRKPTYSSQAKHLAQADDIVHDWTQKGLTVITDEQAHRCCQLLESGYRVCDVSRMTAIERRLIQHFIDGTTPQHREVYLTYNFELVPRKLRTSPETVLKICQLLDNGLGISEVSKQLSCDRKLVSGIANGKTYKSISSGFGFVKRNDYRNDANGGTE